MMTRNLGTLGTLGALIGTLLMQAGCARDQGAAKGSAVVLDRMTSALSLAQLVSINGTYGDDCTNRAGLWSVAIGGGEMTNDELSVVLNDLTCELTLTEVRTTEPLGTVAADVPMVLGAGYLVAPSSFGAGPVFFANAKLTPATFSGDFVLTLVYSDDAALAAAATNTAQFQVVESSATASSVLAPDYDLDVDGLILFTDAANIIVSQSGAATLVIGDGTEQVGQAYFVVAASGLDTYAELDAAYVPASEKAFTASIPVADFALSGDMTGSLVRTLIISNLDAGVRSYQAFQITFNPPVVQ